MIILCRNPTVLSFRLKLARKFPAFRKFILRKIYHRRGLDLQDLVPFQGGRFFLYKIDGFYYPNETLHENVSFQALYNKARNESLYHYEPKAGDIVVDLGAGLGEESVIYSKLVGDQGKVIAIEAEPTVFSVLGETIRRNDLRNIEPLQIAISQSPGYASLKSYGDSYEAAFISENPGEQKSVPADTISSIINKAGISRVDLLKVNIEGAERFVVETLSCDDYKKIRNIAIACHDFRYRREGNDFFRTKELVLNSLEKYNFQIIQRNSPVDYLADWIYATNKLNSE